MTTVEQNLDRTLVTIIANAGQSKSEFLGAIEASKEGRFDDAASLMEAGSKSLDLAHDAHTSLMVHEANDDTFRVTLLAVHASTHMSTAEMSRDLAASFIHIMESGR